MTPEECKKYGLPPGSLWLDEVRFLAPKPQTLDPETQRSTLKLDPPERDLYRTYGVRPYTFGVPERARNEPPSVSGLLRVWRGSAETLLGFFFSRLLVLRKDFNTSSPCFYKGSTYFTSVFLLVLIIHSFLRGDVARLATLFLAMQSSEYPSL